MGLRMLGRTGVIVWVVCSAGSLAMAATLNVPSAGFPTIQSAVDSALPADTIVVKAGVYFENVNIPAGKDGITLRGKGKVVIDAREGGTPAGPGVLIGSPLVTIRNIIVRHAEAAAVSGDGFRSTADNTSIIDCAALNCGNFALFINGNDAVVRGSTFMGCAGGVSIDGDRTLVQDCTVANDSLAGILVKGVDCTVRKCEVRVVDGDGIAMEGNNATVRQNTVTEIQGDGITLASDLATVVDNEVDASTGAGINVDSPGSTITDNRLSNTSGISAEGDDSTISNNVIEATPGFAVDASGNGLTVDDNTISDAAVIGIFITGDQSLVRKNKLRRLGAGITIEGENPLVDSNSVVGTSIGSGMAFEDAMVGGVISANTIRDTAGAAMTFSSVDGAQVFNNTVRGCGINVAAITITGDNFLVSANVIRDNPGDGLAVTGDNNTVNSNEITDNLIDGIDIRGDANTLNGNTVKGNGGEGIQNSGVNTSLLNNVGTGNRIDFASDQTPASFLGNTFATGGVSTPPEID